MPSICIELHDGCLGPIELQAPPEKTAVKSQLCQPMLGISLRKLVCIVSERTQCSLPAVALA